MSVIYSVHPSASGYLFKKHWRAKIVLTRGDGDGKGRGKYKTTLKCRPCITVNRKNKSQQKCLNERLKQKYVGASEARYQNHHDPETTLSFSLPFFDSGGRRRFGVLTMPAGEPRDDNLRVPEPFGCVLGKPGVVGLAGIEDILFRGGAA